MIYNANKEPVFKNLQGSSRLVHSAKKENLKGCDYYVFE